MPGCSRGGCRLAEEFHADPVDLAGEVFEQRPPRLDAGHELVPEAAPWADIQPDMLQLVLRSLPCLADRARVRSICHHWRTIACSHGVAPPLPLLMLPKFRFSGLSSEGALTAVRHLPLPQEFLADDIRWVGSFEGWLGVQPSKYYKRADGKCFLLNAFSHQVVHLPHLSAFNFFNYSGYTTSTLPIINGSGVLYCFVSAREYLMLFSNVVLSASPDPGSKCIVAATSGRDANTTKLALWRHGMRSWCVCQCDSFFGPHDLAFYQGKLYMLSRSGPILRLFAFEIKEDDRGIMVSRVEHCMTEPLACSEYVSQNYNLVEWRGKLLVIIRSSMITPIDERILEVKVCSLDFSTNPYRLGQIHSIDGGCIFVDSCSSKSFPADQYDGVPGDLIYFLDDKNDYIYFKPSYHAFVYSMKDGTVTPFAVELSPGNFGAPEGDFAHRFGSVLLNDLPQKLIWSY
ncbi:hypothetical protein ACQ4PT_009375 [Festuca glaucescens]